MRLSTIFGRGATAVLSVCALALMCDGLVHPAFAGTCCDVNNSGCIYTSPMTFGTGAWPTLCSSIKTSAGNTCVANVPSGTTPIGNVSSGDCITLGAGVTLDLGGATLNCTSTSCATGILNTTSAGASSAVSVKNGKVTGCFANGVAFTGGTNSTISGTVVDGATTAGSPCTNALQSCLQTPRGTTSRVRVLDCFVGISLSAGEDMNDSVIENSYVGIYGQATSSISTVNNVQFLGNGYDVMNLSNGTYKIKVLSSSLQDTVGCPCVDSNTNCITPVTNCMNFGTGSVGDATFVDDTFYP